MVVEPINQNTSSIIAHVFHGLDHTNIVFVACTLMLRLTYPEKWPLGAKRFAMCATSLTTVTSITPERTVPCCMGFLSRKGGNASSFFLVGV